MGNIFATRGKQQGATALLESLKEGWYGEAPELVPVDREDPREIPWAQFLGSIAARQQIIHTPIDDQHHTLAYTTYVLATPEEVIVDKEVIETVLDRLDHAASQLSSLLGLVPAVSWNPESDQLTVYFYN